MEIDFWDVRESYECLKKGKPKMNAIKEAIKEAEKEKNYGWQLMFMEDYIKEAIFYEDAFDAFIIFPEFISIFDKNPVTDMYCLEDMLWVYKWILQNLHAYYQISHNKAIEYFEDFKLRIKENGYSLRTYYFIYYGYMEYINLEESKKAIKEMVKFPRDEISDCYTCENGFMGGFEMRYGNFEKALEIVNPILEGEQKCAEFPFITYFDLFEYYFKKHDFEKSCYYLNKGYKEIYENKSCLNIIGKILEFYSEYDINKGIIIFKRHLNWDLECHNPYHIFKFELGAYKLFNSINKNNKKEIKMLLNNKFPLYNDEGVYNINDLVNYFKNNIINIGKKFDKRNGNNNFMSLIV